MAESRQYACWQQSFCSASQLRKILLTATDLFTRLLMCDCALRPLAFSAYDVRPPPSLSVQEYTKLTQMYTNRIGWAKNSRAQYCK